jgi:lipopolysaccharide export system protein LptA
MNPLKNKLPLLVSTLMAICIGTAHAEKADRDQPIHIESDVMNLDDTTHVSTFTGKVKFTQGTLRLTADKVVVTEDAAGNKACVATGHLASFRQKRDNVNEYVEGYGERIEYSSLNGTVDFYVQARVKREQDDVRGDHITYSTQTEIFHVSGKPNSGRVRAVIQPRNNNAASTPQNPSK